MRNYKLYLTEDEVSDFIRSISFILDFGDVPVSAQENLATLLMYLENLISC